MPSNRDPRKKSRTERNRRTSSSNRSARSKASAKDTPKPTSSSTRASTKGSSTKVTQGSGGIKSKRLKQALDGVKTKRTPAKTPPKATQAGNQRVIVDAFNRTVRERAAQDAKDKANKNKPKPSVKTKPTSSTPRGAQGPRTAPQQGPSQRVSGLQGSRPKPTPNNAPPRSATPRVSNVGPQTRQARAVQQANPGRAARAARTVSTGSRLGQLARTASNPYAAAATIIASDIKNRSVADGTLKGKPNVPTKPGNHKATTKRKEGQKATLNGKPVVWRKGKWVPAPGSNAGNYNTRDADGTVRSRKKVGTKKVGTAEQAFDNAYAKAKKAGKSTFTFKGKKYSTK